MRMPGMGLQIPLRQRCASVYGLAKNRESDMGSRGPVPRADSRDSKYRQNTRYRKPSKAGAGEAKPPPFLKGNAEAMAYWKRHAPDLIEAKRLAPVHADLFGTICEMAADVRRLTAQVAHEGDVIDGLRGPMANPRVKILRDARRDLLSAARGFGLDAASDARLPVDPPDDTMSDDDPLKRFIT